MAKVYADLVRKGLKTMEDVPEKLLGDVERLLEGGGEDAGDKG